MSNDDYTAATRLLANLWIFPDADEPCSYNGVQIGCNAERVLDALKDAGFVLFRARHHQRRGSASA